MRWILCLVSVFLSGQIVSAVAPPLDTTDSGVRDSLYLKVEGLPWAAKGKDNFVVTLYCFSDANTLRGISAGFKWDSPNIRLDSATVSETAISSFNYLYFLFRKNNIDTTNKYRQFAFFGVSTGAAGLKPSLSATALATYYFSASKWTAYDSVAFDTNQFNAGTRYVFTSGPYAQYRPVWGEKLHVYDAERPCCIGQRGNIDGDPAALVDITDLLYLISYVKGETTTLPCPDAANVNGSTDGAVDLADILMLSDYLNGFRESLPSCGTSQ